ncbi:hypothetical protein Tco_0612818 [Tanacetum coccineum]
MVFSPLKPMQSGGPVVVGNPLWLLIPAGCPEEAMFVIEPPCGRLLRILISSCTRVSVPPILASSDHWSFVPSFFSLIRRKGDYMSPKEKLLGWDPLVWLPSS